MNPKLINVIAATAIFLLITVIFGFGGCMALASGIRGGSGMVFGWLWFFVVACAAMWLVLRMFGKRRLTDANDEPSA